MKLIELHILQSFPVSCLNRDDVGAPKTAIFGGVNRSRISSQCLKRAIREYAQKALPTARFNSKRSKLIVEPLEQALHQEGLDLETAQKHARIIADQLGELDKKAEKQGKALRVKTLLFLSQAEIQGLATQVARLVKENKEYSGELRKILKSCDFNDAADIALFGRMVASDASLTLEGAAMFSHALSTHRSDNEIDFYSAVDDLQSKDEGAGAGMIGTLEFSSAVYYRYAAVNLDLLFSSTHLGGLTSEERQEVVEAFIQATLMSVPGARKNSMNADTLPAYVLGIVKDKGQPVQLINAFEEPVLPRGSLVKASVEQIKRHYEELKNTWGITSQLEMAMPETDLRTFCREIVKYVG